VVALAKKKVKKGANGAAYEEKSICFLLIIYSLWLLALFFVGNNHS
jgi:hypothetical protein